MRETTLARWWDSVRGRYDGDGTSSDETPEDLLDERTRAKLEAVREAATYSFPTCDIEQMLAETVAGYVARID